MTKRTAKGRGIWIAMLMAAALLEGCASAPPADVPLPPETAPRQFSNADWATVLSAVTTPDGYVKWDLVQNDAAGVREALLRYVGLVQAVSPENHPGMFASDSDRLAYWINAFNATCMYAVVEHGYPDSMLAGAPPEAIFAVERFTFGGRKMTLNQLIRSKLEAAGDARVFFAINQCATSSAPLRSSPYDGAVLEAQFVDQGRRYLSDPRAAVRDGDSVELNDLFFRYRSDFLSSFQKLMDRKATGILDALQPYVQNDSAIVGSTHVERLGFDWSLNRPPR
ncbi:MAG TPA: DUF547 domain-containing protein [Tepidisphaeraceae bacterium]|nr:DUF547 domain-containing protein [Tepidisphaeraceae bacterium]